MIYKITNSSWRTAVLFGFFALIGTANAQTAPRQKKIKPRAGVAVAQPSGSAEIVRDVYLDGNQIVLGENARTPETTGEPISAPDSRQTVDAADAPNAARMKELSERVKLLESTKTNEYDQKQKRLLLNLDILSRAETRAESLRKQLFEMIEKESGVQTRLEQIRYDARSEVIERSTAFVGSMRPEEVRDQRKKSLEAEKRNLESLLTQIQTSRANLEDSVSKADFLVEKVRLKFDKDIDDALTDKEENQ